MQIFANLTRLAEVNLNLKNFSKSKDRLLVLKLSPGIDDFFIKLNSC